MGATQYSRSHDRHVHSLTSPPACTTVPICLKIMHVITVNIIHSWPLNEQLTLVCERNTYYLQRPGFGSKVSNSKCGTHFCVCPRKPTQSPKVWPHTLLLQACPNSRSTISMYALHKHRGQPHTHTLNTNHGNPSVVQSFCC